MNGDERALLRQEQRVEDAESRLSSMIDTNKVQQDFIRVCTDKAKQCMWWYDQDKDIAHVKAAEKYTEAARDAKAAKYTIDEIRKQREQIQWQKKKLAALKTAQSTEQNKS